MPEVKLSERIHRLGKVPGAIPEFAKTFEEIGNAVAAIEAERDRLEIRNQREHDLVRQQRMELLEADLITREEYAELVSERGAVSRLTDYDRLRSELEADRERVLLLEGVNARICSEAAACVRFLESELGWEDFRSEGFVGKETASASDANCRKLREFLKSRGDHVVKLLDALEAARKDSERLDWLEKSDLYELSRSRNMDDPGKDWYVEIGDQTHHGVGPRDALDAAMAKPEVAGEGK